ncbi:Ino eighty subunit 1 [Ceratocystis fimbriata CBS 114723]|uniref:Ino eighty subunit 1 n=1 Tax=Ceratocystis fimbriata CBS 114723 TaxID=1035309 RepID=A0A2C5X3P3_9PEZI|nr:Ino eighty subunit 1 [Ceratocystis fimbriata CBS 114723]
MPDSPGASDASVASSPAPPTRTHTKTFTTHMYHDDDDSRLGERDTKSSRKSKGGQRDANQSTIGKVKHLKKEDGDPLWRKDIQYDFLRAIFDDDNKVFLNSYEPERLGMQCFADLYIDTMARSSKTSKVLRDKLLSDREAAKGMAMVCLLVNMGRMNTTLNFFPEMRAQLRTYHAIPSLQAHQDTHAYKQLQDAPRLKSILKGAVEDRDEPRSILEIKAKNVPRTNPVNLIFLIVQSAQKIHELHFPLDQEFHDLVMKTNYSSITRAKAFLWLAWFYLESDFTEEGCDENPFGPGVDYGLNVANQGIPSLRALTTEEENEENIDTPEEIEFGEEKRQLRHRILEHDLSAIDNPGKRASRNAVFKPIDDGPAILPHIRPNKQDSELDSPRSTPPPRLLPNRVAGGDRGSLSRRTGQLKHHKVIEAPSPGGSRGGDRERDVDTMPIRKSRPPTAHQLAVERNRNQRVEHILNRGLRKAHHRARKLRRQEGAIVRALRRMEYIDNALAPSDDEEGGPTAMFKQTGLGGLCPLKEEPDDFGEEFASYSASMRRINRRLERWSSARGRGISVVAPVKRIKNPADGNDMDADGNDPEENIGNDTAFDADVVMDETVADETVWE